MDCNIIGAGRLGKQLAYALQAAGLIQLKGVFNQSPKNSLEACNLIGHGQAFSSLHDLPAAKLIFITVPDDQLLPIINELSHSPSLLADSYVIHCSGVYASTILSPLQQKDCHLASFHPLKAFTAGHLDPLAFSKVDCAIEGDERVLDWLKKSFRQLGARIVQIEGKNKALYHAAAVMASNYTVTLTDIAQSLMEQAGIPKAEAYPMICRLIQTSLDNLKNTNKPAKALTGPISRGDEDTINLHLKELTDPLTRLIYQTAGLATIELASLPPENKSRLAKILKVE